MYIIKTKKNTYKLVDKNALNNLEGFLFGSKAKTYKIAGQQIDSLIIYNKKLAHPIAKKQVDKTYKKLITVLTDLLVSDDEDGQCYREALDRIERFRQIVKNKYRRYLSKKDLEEMSKNLSLLQKEASKRFLELQRQISKSVMHSSHK